MPTAHRSQHNQLLVALHAVDFDRLSAHLELVAMPLGTVLYQPGEQIQHAYFPTSAIVSLHHVMRSGASSEAASVGREGMVGVSLFLGGQSMPSSALVQIAGQAWRLERQALIQEFNRRASMQQVLLGYTSGLMTQMSQTAICNRHHSVMQQLCRWLLSALDRVPLLELKITQEMVASLLGVRREGITAALGKLQLAGLIRLRRGHISVLDRRGLETLACECYGVVRKAFSHLLEPPDPARQSARAAA
jgi:CRP-like cAMP-binding protein